MFVHTFASRPKDLRSTLLQRELSEIARANLNAAAAASPPQLSILQSAMPVDAARKPKSGSHG